MPIGVYSSTSLRDSAASRSRETPSVYPLHACIWSQTARPQYGSADLPGRRRRRIPRDDQAGSEAPGGRTAAAVDIDTISNDRRPCQRRRCVMLVGESVARRSPSLVPGRTGRRVHHWIREPETWRAGRRPADTRIMDAAFANMAPGLTGPWRAIVACGGGGPEQRCRNDRSGASSPRQRARDA